MGILNLGYEDALMASNTPNREAIAYRTGKAMPSTITTDEEQSALTLASSSVLCARKAV